MTRSSRGLALTKSHPAVFVLVLLLALVLASVRVIWLFDRDIKAAVAKAALGGVLINTLCGPIEYQEAGSGTPLLVVHGSGGGHDRGMALAVTLAMQGVRVIAMSRFGYLRTPLPPDASASAQADAHACLLDALGIQKAAVAGYSAGGPSALELAIRHPERVSALVLLMPVTYLPASSNPLVSPTSTPMSTPTCTPIFSPATSPLSLPRWIDNAKVRLADSDFLVWAVLGLFRRQVTPFILATPHQLLTTSSPREQARVSHMVDQLLPVSARAAGVKNDNAAAQYLAALPLATIQMPTLIVSARDDRYDTYAGSKYTASQIKGAKFVGFEHGGHVWVGHDDQVMAEVVKLIVPVGKP